MLRYVFAKRKAKHPTQDRTEIPLVYYLHTLYAAEAITTTRIKERSDIIKPGEKADSKGSSSFSVAVCCIFRVTDTGKGMTNGSLRTRRRIFHFHFTAGNSCKRRRE